jgi:hypothetical protein
VITGPEEGAAAGRSRLRASHADREHVIDTLKTAFANSAWTFAEPGAPCSGAPVEAAYLATPVK